VHIRVELCHELFVTEGVVSFEILLRLSYNHQGEHPFQHPEFSNPFALIRRPEYYY
jgi:hypothetical protein